MTTFIDAQNKTKEPAKPATVYLDDCEAETKRGELTCKLIIQKSFFIPALF